MNKSENIGQLAEALAKAQGELESATKDSDNPFFKSKYADLAEVWRVIKKPFTDNGLAISQLTHVADPLFMDDDKGVTKIVLFAVVETVLMHKSGEWISSECKAPITKNDPQGIGSAITYLRRYGLSAIAGVVQEDDDGNSASGGNVGANPRVPNTRPATSATPKASAPISAGKPVPPTSAELFGKGAAFNHEAEIKAVLGELNKRKVYPQDNTPWDATMLDAFCQREYDKPLNRLDEDEVNVLVADFTEQLKELKAIEAESTPSHTGPVIQSAPADKPATAMATPAQVTTLRKLCEIKDLNESEIMRGVTNGNRTAFEDLAEEEAKAMIKEIQKK